MDTSRKSCNFCVYPANGAMGYAVCKMLMEHEKMMSGTAGGMMPGMSSGRSSMKVNKILAVCCHKEGKYIDKLKELGKEVKVVILKDATHMDDWKKELKDEHVDCMCICTDPTATRDMNKGMTMGASMTSTSMMSTMTNMMMGAAKSDEDMMKCMAKSMECAVEMCQHMKCKCMCVATAMCAHDSKYKMLHHMYSGIEKAADKHFKGECSTMFCNMMYEMMRYNRMEIKEQKQMSWPCKEDAECCPMARSEMACCCVDAMCEMLKMTTMAEPMKHHEKYHLTGMHKMTPRDMCDMMSKGLDTRVQYTACDHQQWKDMMKDRYPSFEICCMMEMFEMMNHGHMCKCHKDAEKLMGKSPMSLEKWVMEHEQDFRMM